MRNNFFDINKSFKFSFQDLVGRTIEIIEHIEDCGGVLIAKDIKNGQIFVIDLDFKYKV